MRALLGLVGKKLSHSFSQDYFRQKFSSLGLHDVGYLLFELDTVDELPALIKKNPQLVGFNVTVPYKESVMKFLNEVDDVANEVGAVNTVLIRNSKLIGYNTDAIGFESLLEEAHVEPNTEALILGTGGSSKAVQYVLSKRNISFQLVSRAPQPNRLAYDSLNARIFAQHRLIINTTPLGMHPNVEAAPPLNYSLLTPRHLLIDLIYNPAKTKFLRQGRLRGARTFNGLTMLHAQADAAWNVWQLEVETRLRGG